MPYVYRPVDVLQNKPWVDGGICVSLIKKFAPGLIGQTTLIWREGARVVDSPNPERGTAIATFEKGRYPRRNEGQAIMPRSSFGMSATVSPSWISSQLTIGQKRKSAAPPTFLRLQGGAVMRGHPDKEGYLVPDRTRKIKGGTVQTFIFDAGEERWLWCAYGIGSPQLAKRLVDTATECAVTVRETKQDGVTETTAICR